MLRQSEVCSEQFELIDSAGHSKWLQLILHRIDDDLWQGILNDITELKRHELYQQSIANTDALTGIANRRLFDHHLDNLIRQPLSSASPFILMLIDLDWFKQVNDLYGHSAGDTVLQKMAEILQASVRTADFIGRLGGDEFAVILANCPQVETAAQIAQKIIASIKQPILVNEMDYVRVGASIGIAVCDRGCTSLSELFDHADSALYQAKADGRNCFRVYSDELTAQVSC
jgi:diguanylate cyclase (GGDEF)-like protein